jgi:hypothetical protein
LIEGDMHADLEPLALWNRFKEVFKSTAQEPDPQEMVTAWESSTNRTRFVKIFLSRVAAALGLTLECELWKVDFALSVVSETETKVPVIFVESENAIKDVYRPGGEVRKL